MRAFFKSIFGMFLGNDGIVSSTKLMSFIGYGLFIFISIWTAIYNPEKFNYELFAILSAASSSSMRVVDKWLNVRSYTTAASAVVETGVTCE
ncbi:MAG: hypothetical protein CVT92_02385 [Bacteroidetes bacterium HGW-Bacteroidetes-1]|jgi:hypothetical protein|nr:MAG: hypothetical protein CVT92_02385 [Bacteroidetes bacterium HGW-Bacteroidetes-1]